jgi:signal transduction histidine kinase
MTSLKRWIVVFAVGIWLPLGYFVLQAYRSLESEEAATLSYFADTLFDEMQESVAALLRREEARPIDAYSPEGPAGADSPLSRPPAEEFIRGYFQNNPDGGFQTPLVPAGRADHSDAAVRLAEMEEANRVFNRMRAEGTDRIRAEPRPAVRDEAKKEQKGFAEKFLDVSRSQRSKGYLGERQARLEQVTPEQAAKMPGSVSNEAVSRTESPAAASASDRRSTGAPSEAAAPEAPASPVRPQMPERAVEAGGVQAEVAPFQSVFLDDGRVYVFRRVMIDGRLYRQGFVVEIDALLAHLTRAHFSSQPMARFTRLQLRALDQGRETRRVEAGPPADKPRIVLDRTFPQPFAFLRATLACDRIPPSAGRSTLNLALAGLAGVVLVGLLAIYHSARKIVDFSERQSRFVSSVTHELKTPLTNIRMYIEMLEQGVAQDPDREQEYFRVLQAEGARLSRLITNVLELSRLERSHRRPNLVTGGFEEVAAEAEGLMRESLRQGGVSLTLENNLTRPFRYDREIMVQVLINLIENSLKFGRDSAVKAITVRVSEEGGRVRIEVADTGPGIPRRDLKKVFNDFYRAENALSSGAGGTGIGLALVRRFVGLMGGKVSAANNAGPGCTVRIELPR